MTYAIGNAKSLVPSFPRFLSNDFHLSLQLPITLRTRICYPARRLTPILLGAKRMTSSGTIGGFLGTSIPRIDGPDKARGHVHAYQDVLS